MTNELEKQFTEKLLDVLHLIVLNSNVYSLTLGNELSDLKKIYEEINNDR